jgi:hypothetical protein
MVDSTYLVEVYRPQQKKKMPDAQKNREVSSIADLMAAGGGNFVKKTGDTMTGPLVIDQNVAGLKARLAMVLPGSQQDAPTTFGIASTYLGIGGGEWNVNSYRLLGFGYISAAGDEYPAVIGYEELVKTGNTQGDLVFGARPTHTNVAPPINLRIRGADGQILAEDAAYVPSDPKSLTNKAFVDAEFAKAIPMTQKGVASGVATLDASGKVPASELNVSGLAYKGDWNASTNTPTLANGTGVNGDFYKVSVAGNQNLGGGAADYAVGDWVMYDGAVWDHFGAHEAVASVNGKTGVVVLVAADVGAVDLTTAQAIAGIKTFSASPIVPTPTTPTQAANMGFVTGLDGANVKLTGNQTVAGIKTFSASPIVPTPTTATQVANMGYVDGKTAANINAPAFTTVGGHNIAAGTIASQLKALGDLADPA